MHRSLLLVRISTLRNNYMLRINTILILIFSSFALFTMCKKDNDNYPQPLVSLSSPLNYQSYNVYDSIKIKGTVSHVRNIRKISLTVTDKDLTPVISGKIIEINNTEYLLDTYLIIDNKYIEEPLNYLLLKVEDDQKTYNYWFTITINPLSKQLKELLVVTGAGNNNTLYRMKTNEVPEQVFNWTSEYLGGYGDSKNMMFYTSGEQLDGLRGFNLVNNQTSWIVNSSSGSLPHFNVFSGSEGKISIGLTEGLIESFNSSGMIILSTKKKNSGRFTEILNMDKYVISAFKKYSDQSGAIMIYNYPAGNVYDSIYFAGNSVHFLAKDSKDVLMLLAEDGKNKAYVYNYSSKSINFLNDVTSDTIREITGDYDNMFLLTSSSILWYRPTIASCVQLISSVGANAITYDPISKVIFVGVENRIEMYSFPEGVLIGTVNFSNRVKDIDLIYNK